MNHLEHVLAAAVASTAQGNATEGRVYGGDCGLIHIEDGRRAVVGGYVADFLEQVMRNDAFVSGARSYTDVYGIAGTEVAPLSLCPGCYMVAVFNACVALAKANGQDMRELGATMRDAFDTLARDGDATNMESIAVRIDPA